MDSSPGASAANPSGPAGPCRGWPRWPAAAAGPGAGEASQDRRSRASPLMPRLWLPSLSPSPSTSSRNSPPPTHHRPARHLRALAELPPPSPPPPPPRPSAVPPLSEPERRRPGGRADAVFPTAPHAFQSSPSISTSAAADPPRRPSDLRLPRLSQQPSYPSFISAAGRPSQHLTAAAAAEGLHPQHPRHARRPPFWSRAAASSPPPPRRSRLLSSARLWNPTNSTPRNAPPRKRRSSTPPAPPVPLQHPALDNSVQASEGAGDYPLLTLPEQRQSRHSPSTRASLQIDRSGSHDQRVSLPRSLRVSASEIGFSIEAESCRRALEELANSIEPVEVDKGKGKAAMAPESEDPKQSDSRDLERGPDVMEPLPSNGSARDAIGSALSSSNSSIRGEDVQPDAGEEWGPQHPCYPHLNPHVPVDSAEYAATRIIRIRRDWLLQGDLAPTFSNLYPEILDSAGVSEHEFRRVVERLNRELVPIFDPYSVRNVVDCLLGLATGWLWDDFGLSAVKSRLNEVEKWIDRWNSGMEKAMASDEGAVPPKIISLRQTGYMTLDIQIPDPEIAPAPSTAGAGEPMTPLAVEPTPPAIAA